MNAQKSNFRYTQRSENLDEIIGHVPHWFIRWGILVVSFITFIFFSLSFLIHFPNTVNVHALVYARESIQRFSFSKTPNDSLLYLYSNNNSIVSKGDTILKVLNQNNKVISSVTSKLGGRIVQYKNFNNFSETFTTFVIPFALSYNVKIKLGADNFSKVKLGQKLSIKLDAFPENDFGALSCEIKFIIPALNKNYYQVEAVLDRGLTTNKNCVLPNMPYFTGKAAIIIDDKTIFQRLVETFL